MKICLLKTFCIFIFAIFFFIFAIFTIPIAVAGIYQCVDEKTGVVEFRDKPCVFSAEQQFLPIQYQKTEEKVVLKQEKEIKIINKDLEKKEKQEERLKERTKKRLEKEQAKAERRKIRCDKLDEKIKHIENQLRQGSKMKRRIRLNEQLAHCEEMKRKYCSE